MRCPTLKERYCPRPIVSTLMPFWGLYWMSWKMMAGMIGQRGTVPIRPRLLVGHTCGALRRWASLVWVRSPAARAQTAPPRPNRWFQMACPRWSNHSTGATTGHTSVTSSSTRGHRLAAPRELGRRLIPSRWSTLARSVLDATVRVHGPRGTQPAWRASANLNNRPLNQLYAESWAPAGLEAVISMSIHGPDPVRAVSPVALLMRKHQGKPVILREVVESPHAGGAQ